MYSQNLITESPKRPVGRPITVTEGDMYRMMEFLRKGYTVTLACVKAGLPRSVFYAEMKRNEEFRDKITAVQDEMTNRATSIIYRSIRKGELDTAKWWLDRQDRRERNA